MELDLDAVAAADYAAELDRCCVALEQWPAACGCNGRLCVSGHIGNMTRRIREQDAEIERWKDQWSVMARACGNWRTWPGEAEDDHDHSDWLAASRAIIERDELIAEIERLREGIETAIEAFIDGDPFVIDDLRAVLKLKKGGES